MSAKELPVIVNPVLAYGYVRLKTCTIEEVSCSLFATFEKYEFKEAKDILWERVAEEMGNCDALIGKNTRRNSTTTRCSAEANCQDIVKALHQLSKENAVPELAVGVGDLEQLPPIVPHFVYARRLNAVREQQVHAMEEEIQRSQKTLDSIQETQKRMGEELSRLRRQVDASPMEPRPSTPRPSQPDQKSAPVASCRPTQVYKDADPTPPHRQEESWTTVRRAKRRRNQKVVTGTNTDGDCGIFRGAQEVRSVFVFNVQKDATTDSVSQWLRSKAIETVAVRIMSHPDAVLRSFKVSVNKDKASALLSPDFQWPSGVKVRRFVP